MGLKIENFTDDYLASGHQVRFVWRPPTPQGLVTVVI
jgi:hypothetical protein